ncbi:hypothetical protein BJX64DRAFT_246481 [Aspergillus heterothallicus]
MERGGTFSSVLTVEMYKTCGVCVSILFLCPNLLIPAVSLFWELGVGACRFHQLQAPAVQITTKVFSEAHVKAQAQALPGVSNHSRLPVLPSSFLGCGDLRFNHYKVISALDCNGVYHLFEPG